MSDQVTLAVIGLLTSMVTAMGGVMVGLLRQLNRKVGDTNGKGSLTDILLEHEQRLTEIRVMFSNHVVDPDAHLRVPRL